MENVSPAPRVRYGRRRIVYAILIFLGYYALAKAGLLLATINKSASPIWPASGFAIALLSRAGRRYAFVIALAAFVANFQTRVPLLAVSAISIGNMLEGYVGSILFDRAKRKKMDSSGAETLMAMLLSAVLATPISATVGTSVLVFAGAIEPASFGATWITWWIGDTLGAFIFAPFFLRLFEKKMARPVPRPRWVALIALATALSAFVFFHPDHPIAFLFSFYPVLLLGVFALNPRESSALTVIFTLAAVVGTATGHGPFFIGSTNDNLICIALFLTSLAITEQGLQFIKDTGNIRVCAVVLLAGWGIGAIILQGFNRNEEAIDRARFQQLVDGTMSQFSQRALVYEAALRGGVGLFRASDHVTARSWKNYVDSLDIDRNYAGLLGLGYVLDVPDTELKSFVRRVRSEGNPNFEVHPVVQPGVAPPPESRSRHFVIVAVEPRERNATALGLDAATEPNRYEGALRAARTGLPALSRPVRLVQDAKQRTGFLFFLPIYRNTPGKELVGWVYSPLVLDEFLGNANLANDGEVEFEIGVGSPEPTLFTNVNSAATIAHQTPFRTERKIWGQDFIFRWYRSPTFRSRHDTTSAWVVFACAFLNILLCAFIAILEGLSRRANELAKRQAGEIRLQQAKLEHSSRLATLGEMAGGIAHEINNPLAILSGRANLLGRLADAGDVRPEIIRQNSDKIMETVDRMAKIINGLRSFSRNGERDPFRAVTLEKVVSATLDFCSERFRNQQIDFRLGRIPDLELVCREVQVVQVLLNLLNNAHDAVLAAEERWIALDVRVFPSKIEFIVSDSGSGIPDDVVENMMTPFFTTKPVGQGTGLGLSISSGIAEEHAGSLRYDEASERTRFIFSVSRTLQT